MKPQPLVEPNYVENHEISVRANGTMTSGLMSRNQSETMVQEIAPVAAPKKEKFHKKIARKLKVSDAVLSRQVLMTACQHASLEKDNKRTTYQ